MKRTAKSAPSKVAEDPVVPPTAFTDAMFRIYGTGSGLDWYESKEFKMFIAGARFMSELLASRGGRACDTLQHMIEFEGRAK